MDRRDIVLLFATRIVRMFGYGLLSVVLALYLTAAGLTTEQVGLLFTFTLIGDAAISLWLTTNADRLGRQRMLLVSAALMLGAGAVFAFTNNVIVLTIAGIIGVISPSGKEIGPFLSIEQASLTQLIPNERRTHTFAWYNFAGSLAVATGALIGGLIVQSLRNAGVDELNADRVLVVGYALIGATLIVMYAFNTRRIEIDKPKITTGFLGLSYSRNIVYRLSALFALDAFAGGFVIDSFIAYWLSAKFNVEPAALGAIFFGTNLLAGISALLAAPLAKRFGLINTMVWTHIPSNVMLMLVPLMPTLPLTIVVLLIRFSISQMDVPTRQSYTMAVVAPEERSAASGVTSIARSVGSAVSPSLAGIMLAGGAVLFSAPFFVAGSLKIVYDVLLYRSFIHTKPPEEQRQPA